MNNTCCEYREKIQKLSDFVFYYEDFFNAEYYLICTFRKTFLPAFTFVPKNLNLIYKNRLLQVRQHYFID